MALCLLCISYIEIKAAAWKQDRVTGWTDMMLWNPKSAMKSVQHHWGRLPWLHFSKGLRRERGECECNSMNRFQTHFEATVQHFSFSPRGRHTSVCKLYILPRNTWKKEVLMLNNNTQSANKLYLLNRIIIVRLEYHSTMSKQIMTI